ncbi:MAG: DnaA regulatory inactivator Hda [Betaproteobacteria bacterium]|nr:MAG: DnaA regulatory inactivator Hda [Betaproteobacteria bacterium]
MRQMALSLAPAPAPTLRNFVHGRNAELMSLLSALANGARAERFVYIWGVRGCGKTHLLRAMGAAFAEHNVATAVFTGGELQVDIPQCEVILADDVDQLTESDQERLFNVYNKQRDGGGVLIAAGAVPPARLELRNDLVTRLGWGLVYQVHTLSDEEKMAAMIEHARARGFSLNREVIDYLLKRQARDLPGLLGMLDALDRYSLESKRAVTIPLVRELLSEPPAEG